MTTDDKTLTEQIARAQVGSPTDYEWRTWGEDSPGLRAITLQNATRLLPIIRKAQADALRDAAGSFGASGNIHYPGARVRERLRARARRIEKEQTNG